MDEEPGGDQLTVAVCDACGMRVMSTRMTSPDELVRRHRTVGHCGPGGPPGGRR